MSQLLTIAGSTVDLIPLTAARSLAPGVLLTWGFASGRPRWLILAGVDDVRVNGLALPMGLRVLAHRDLIAVGSSVYFFSAETPAQVAPYAGGAKAATCPRCKDELAAGQLGARCASCGTVHHQMAERMCFTYAPACANCGAPTTLDGALQWTPEDL